MELWAVRSPSSSHIQVTVRFFYLPNDRILRLLLQGLLGHDKHPDIQVLTKRFTFFICKFAHMKFCLGNQTVYSWQRVPKYGAVVQWLPLLQNLIPLSLTRVLCRFKFCSTNVWDSQWWGSDNGPSWKWGYTRFAGQQYHKNNSSSSWNFAFYKDPPILLWGGSNIYFNMQCVIMTLTCWRATINDVLQFELSNLKLYFLKLVSLIFIWS